MSISVVSWFFVHCFILLLFWQFYHASIYPGPINMAIRLRVGAMSNWVLAMVSATAGEEMVMLISHSMWTLSLYIW